MAFLETSEVLDKVVAKIKEIVPDRESPATAEQLDTFYEKLLILGSLTEDQPTRAAVAIVLLSMDKHARGLKDSQQAHSVAKQVEGKHLN